MMISFEIYFVEKEKNRTYSKLYMLLTKAVSALNVPDYYHLLLLFIFMRLLKRVIHNLEWQCVELIY